MHDQQTGNLLCTKETEWHRNIVRLFLAYCMAEIDISAIPLYCRLLYRQLVTLAFPVETWVEEQGIGEELGCWSCAVLWYERTVWD